MRPRARSTADVGARRPHGRARASGGQDDVVTPPTAPGSTGPGRQPPPGGTAGSTGTTAADPTATTRGTTTRPPRSQNWVVKWVLSLGPDAPNTPAIEIEPYLSLLDKCGIRLKEFGDSNERLAEV